MKVNWRTLIVLTVLSMAISSCSTWNKLNETERGAVIGTGSGAVVGGAVGGTPGAVIGGVGGGVAGGLIGHEMDEDHQNKKHKG